MEKVMNIGLFGDSILKGIQINPLNKKYYINNNINIEVLRKKYFINIENYSSFGCTVTKGSNLLEKRLKKDLKCDTIIMDYGGNDCDYNWKEIAENPEASHSPNTPLDLFTETYCNMIETLKSKGIRPILTTLPPLDSQRFFEWFCKDLNKSNILRWLGEINNIYHHQEVYSKEIERIALIKNVPLIDLRGAFLKAGDVERLLCEDGTHPNTTGQKIIAASFCDFVECCLSA